MSRIPFLLLLPSSSSSISNKSHSFETLSPQIPVKLESTGVALIEPVAKSPVRDWHIQIDGKECIQNESVL